MIMGLRGVLNHRLLGKVKLILKFENRDDIPDLFLNNKFFQALPFKEKEKVKSTLNLSYLIAIVDKNKLCSY